MRTPICVQGPFVNGDGSPATGTICAAPTNDATDGTASYGTETVCGVLDQFGRLAAQSYDAFTLLDTSDESITPADLAYMFTVRLDGETLSEFKANVPSDQTSTESHGTGDSTSATPAVVVLADLVVGLAMLGATVTSSDVSTGAAVVIDVDLAANSIMLDNDVTGGTYDGNLVLTISNSVDWVYLVENAL